MRKLLKMILVILMLFVFETVNVYAADPTSTTDTTTADTTKTLEISTDSMTCKEILGDNLTLVLNAAIKLLRIGGAAFATVLASVTLLKAVGSDNKDALKKAGQTCVRMGLVLLIIGLFPTLARFVGNLLEFDISCIV